MLKVVYIYEVSKEKQDEYQKVTAEKIKPFWESHGCQAYKIWQSQEDPNAFMKEMLFTDRAALQGAMAVPEAEAIKELFFQFAVVKSKTAYTLTV
jgi:quinol monooxygenase YgiN